MSHFSMLGILAFLHPQLPRPQWWTALRNLMLSTELNYFVLLLLIFFLSRCMKELGQRNSEAIPSLVPELLTTHPYFAVPEPNLDDHVYTAVAILVFNAAIKCPTIQSLLPEHTKRHYDYLRDSLPDLVPELRTNIGSISKTDNTGACMLSFFDEFILARRLKR